ncbi:MAG: VOC family protein [Armatimonadetes bacterium]|nr:VOC family protein [Armatimonadota bacterium]
MVKGPHTTWCQVSDMDRSVVFYRDVLGLTPGHLSPYWSDFQVGPVKIGLHPRLASSPDPLGIEGKGWYLGFETDDLRSLRSQVEESEGGVVGGYHETPGGVVATFVDPDGNPIQVVQPGSRMSDFE